MTAPPPPPAAGFGDAAASWWYPPAPPRPWPGLRPDGSTKGPPLWLGLTILGLGLLIAVVALVGIVRRVGDFTDHTAFTAPGEVTVHLDDGAEWRLFHKDDEDDRIGTLDLIEVNGPSPVRLRFVDSTDQFLDSRNVGDFTYEEFASFNVDEAGDYTIVASGGPDTSSFDLLVGRSTVSLFGSGAAIGAWVLVGGFAGTILLIGGVLLIVSLVNRSKAKRSRAQIAAGPPV